jgi:hypothetical protein
MDSRMVLIWRAGDQLPDHRLVWFQALETVSLLFRTSKQIRPSLSMLGWYILVRKRILGGVMG